MLSHPILPGIDICLDPEAMRAQLQRGLPEFDGSTLAIDRLCITKARRNTSRQRNPNPLTLCYEVHLNDLRNGTRSVRHYYSKVYRHGASAEAAHGPEAIHIAGLDMLLWPWPHDPGLPQLSMLVDSQRTIPLWGGPAQECSVLRYEPEQRATLRYARHCDSTRPEFLYAKTFHDNRGEAIHRRFVHFWRVAEADANAPLVARPVGYCKKTNTFWQAAANGVPLPQAIEEDAAQRLPELVARAINAVHVAPLSLAGPAARDVGYWITEIQRRRKKISRALPALTERVERLADAIEQLAGKLPAAPLTLIYGDCHPGQMWLDKDRDRIVLFDFDEFAPGDPMEDLAAFIVRLDMAGEHTSFVHALCRAYARIAPTSYCPRRLQWHLAVQRMLQASRAFVFQIAGWESEVEQRLARAEAEVAVNLMEVPA